MPTLDKYHAADTTYEEDDAAYDGADYNFQIVDDSDDVVCLCPTAEIRDKLLVLLNSDTSDRGHDAS